mmetsp:Transcript_144868/g.351799  ORF Transcript_144868/g.351799 Transcript_144868/m.351799 type:complete len:352 (+) Transcript_144868:488-1543(+)
MLSATTPATVSQELGAPDAGALLFFLGLGPSPPAGVNASGTPLITAASMRLGNASATRSRAFLLERDSTRMVISAAPNTPPAAAEAPSGTRSHTRVTRTRMEHRTTLSPYTGYQKRSCAGATSAASMTAGGEVSPPAPPAPPAPAAAFFLSFFLSFFLAFLSFLSSLSFFFLSFFLLFFLPPTTRWCCSGNTSSSSNGLLRSTAPRPDARRRAVSSSSELALPSGSLSSAVTVYDTAGTGALLPAREPRERRRDPPTSSEVASPPSEPKSSVAMGTSTSSRASSLALLPPNMNGSEARDFFLSRLLFLSRLPAVSAARNKSSSSSLPAKSMSPPPGRDRSAPAYASSPPAW